MAISFLFFSLSYPPDQKCVGCVMLDKVDRTTAVGEDGGEVSRFQAERSHRRWHLKSDKQ